MAKIKIVAGDLDAGAHDLYFSTLKVQDKSKLWAFEDINLSTALAHIEIVTEQNKKAISGTLIGGMAGLALLGPLGAVGGMLIGGNKKKVSFVAALADGRQFLGQTDADTYMKMQGWAMGKLSAPNNINADVGSQNTDVEMDMPGFALGVPISLFDQYIELSKDPSSMDRATALHAALIEEYPESQLAKQHNDFKAEARVMEKMYDKLYEGLTPEERQAAELKEMERQSEFMQGIPIAEWEEYSRLVSGTPNRDTQNDPYYQVRIFEDYEDRLCAKYPNSEFAREIAKSRQTNGGRTSKPKSKRKGLFSWG